MGDVSPSQAEAAARAVHEARGDPPVTFEDYTTEGQAVLSLHLAKAMLAAVGDALRLEGAEDAESRMVAHLLDPAWGEDCKCDNCKNLRPLWRRLGEAYESRGRLEGAQAEHARIEKALRYALRTRGPLGDEACLAAALDALKL